MAAREIYHGITIDPDVVHGEPTIAGTRIPVDLVLGQIKGGVSHGELGLEYHLTEQQIQDALAYGATRQQAAKQ